MDPKTIKVTQDERGNYSLVIQYSRASQETENYTYITHTQGNTRVLKPCPLHVQERRVTGRLEFFTRRGFTVIPGIGRAQ